MEISEKRLKELLVEFWMKGYKCSEEGHDASTKTLAAMEKEAKEQALDVVDELCS